MVFRKGNGSPFGVNAGEGARAPSIKSILALKLSACARMIN
jgi:hypothetical protein